MKNVKELLSRSEKMVIISRDCFLLLLIYFGIRAQLSGNFNILSKNLQLTNFEKIFMFLFSIAFVIYLFIGNKTIRKLKDRYHSSLYFSFIKQTFTSILVIIFILELYLRFLR